jgi:hypothetical protein
VWYTSVLGVGFDADLDPDLVTSFTNFGKSEDKNFSFIHISANPHCLIFLVSVIGVIIFSILDSTNILKKV